MIWGHVDSVEYAFSVEGYNQHRGRRATGSSATRRLCARAGRMHDRGINTSGVLENATSTRCEFYTALDLLLLVLRGAAFSERVGLKSMLPSRFESLLQLGHMPSRLTRASSSHAKLSRQLRIPFIKLKSTLTDSIKADLMLKRSESGLGEPTVV